MLQLLQCTHEKRIPNKSDRVGTDAGGQYRAAFHPAVPDLRRNVMPIILFQDRNGINYVQSFLEATDEGANWRINGHIVSQATYRLVIDQISKEVGVIRCLLPGESE